MHIRNLFHRQLNFLQTEISDCLCCVLTFTVILIITVVFPLWPFSRFLHLHNYFLPSKIFVICHFRRNVRFSNFPNENKKINFKVRENAKDTGTQLKQEMWVSEQTFMYSGIHHIYSYIIGIVCQNFIFYGNDNRHNTKTFCF